MGALAIPLAKLVGDLRAVDASSLSGVSQSTLSRLWDNPRWIERVEGGTLSKLMAVSPSIARYVQKWGENQRLDAAVQSTHAAGASIREAALGALIRSAPVSTVITLLSGVAEMLHGRSDNASRLFSAGWGQRTNGVADMFFASGPAGIFENHDSVLKSADEFVSDPPGFADVAQIVGYGIVEHKLIKAGVLQPRHVQDTSCALTFLTRSTVIARLLAEDDLSFVEWYQDRVGTEQGLAAMELWSHATYAGDMTLGRRRLPKNTSLALTAAMTASDMRTQNNAYVYYLVRIALPLLLAADPGMTGRCPAVVSALKSVAEERNDDRLQAAAHTLHCQIDPQR
ncbi:hypothetical protein ACXPWS_28990 [Mycobacterium sp. BMJ-28]